jgi:hypothetical protein
MARGRIVLDGVAQLENSREMRRERYAASRHRFFVGAKAPTYKDWDADSFARAARTTRYLNPHPRLRRECHTPQLFTTEQTVVLRILMIKF